MRNLRSISWVCLALAVCMFVGVTSAAAEVTLLQAIEQVEKETKLLVVKAATAGSCHRIVAVGNGKTKRINVAVDSGKLDVTSEEDWSATSKKIFESATIPCSAAVANALKECDGELRRAKAGIEEDAAKFTIGIKSKVKGPVAVSVCGVSGKVGAVKSTEDEPEACESPE